MKTSNLKPGWPYAVGAMCAVSAGFFAATLAAMNAFALGQEPPSKARTEAIRPAAARPLATTATPAPVDAGGLSLEPTSIDPPAPPGSTFPAVAAEPPTGSIKEHEILMTWLAPGESGGKLLFARLSGSTWSQPVTVAEHVSTLAPTDGPSLTVIDTQAVRRTLVARTGEVVAQSGDGGRTWTRLPAVPPLAFASFSGGDEAGYAFWLAAGENGSAKLLGSRILAGQTLLDPRVSGGSGTSAAMTWDGPVVVYRDLGDDGTQDIAVVRREKAKWSEPQLVQAEGWRPAQPPKSGPHVAAQRRQVAIAWYTEAAGWPRVLVAFSSDAGRTFGASIDVDAAESAHVPSGAVSVALDEDGHALVLWIAANGPNEATLNLARVSADGKQGEPLVLAKGHPTRLGDLPQIARAGDRVAVTWTEGILRRVRAVAIPLAGIPPPGSRRPRPAVAAKPRTGRVGDLAPDLELVSLDGKKVSIESLRGRVVLVNLWATWCAPCILEMPELAALHERHGQRGLVVVGVNTDSADAADKVRAFVTQRKIPFVVWLDPEMSVARALRVQGLPATFVIDRQGRIVLRRDRPITANEPELTQALKSALTGS